MLSVDHLSTTTIVDAANDDFAVKQRLNSFKLGKVMPPSLSMDAPGATNAGHRHRRSHSRNVSISSTSSQTPSFPSSKSSGHNDLSSFSFGSLSTSSSALALSSSESTPSALPNPGLAPPAPKRNSHHRRRSSVSTRHESAELMGVSLPDLPSISMEDNVNLGEKDSIRRRALWALEGKPDVSYGKVEIPELGTPDMEKMMFDFSTKPSLTGGSSKRDSFKLLPPSGSTKDQLHTLLEEEEEEEECEDQDRKDPQDSLPSPTTSNEEGDFPAPVNSDPAVVATKSPTSRPRPATLHLRPLSLTPDTVGSTGLPTPSLTPSPRSGLRSLALNPAQAADDSTAPDAASRRPMLNLNTDSATDPPSNYGDRKPQRRSSISYRRSSSHSSFGLPTPEMTPTFNRRCSVSESIRSSKSGDDEFFPAHPSYRPLSASEQHFLYKSHNALLARITDLEKALSMRRVSMSGYSISGSSRPSSVLSDVSLPSDFGSPASSVPGEPSDEMLALIRDLKAERDELKKDVDGWRTRVADLDKQLVLVARRFENERKEAWVARSRVGLLEAEKAALDYRLAGVDEAIASLEGEKADLRKENLLLKQENQEKDRRIRELEEELKSMRMELQRERDREAYSRAAYNFDPMATPTPLAFDQNDIWNKGLGLDTSLEDRDQSFSFALDGDDDGYLEEDGLVGYEDEDECDPKLETSSSFGSFSDYPRGSTEHLAMDAPTSLASDNASPRPIHGSRHSLSRTWTFPKVTSAATHDEQSDKFFGCMDESDASDDSEPLTPMPFNYEESKDIFASALKFADEDDAPFYIPGGVGTVVEAPIPVLEVKNERSLGVLTEEDEDVEQDALWDMEDEEMFGEIGGIRIIFTPPEDVDEVQEVEQIKFVTPAKPVSAPPTLPAFDFGNNDEKDAMNPFMFGHASPPPSNPSIATQSTPLTARTSPPRSKPSMMSPPSSIPRSKAIRATSPPSAIPRPASRTSTTCSSPQASSPYVTPLSKRGGTMPCFIPQPVSSPSPSRIAISKLKSPTLGSTFVRQPSCTNPLTPTSPKVTSSKLSTTFANEETMNVAVHRSSEHLFDVATPNQCHPNHRSPSETNMKSVDLRYTSKNLPLPSAAYPTPDSSTFASIPPVSSILPTPISSKLSFSTFSTLLPLSWSSRPSAEAPPVVSTQAEKTASLVSRKQQLFKLRRRMQVEGTGTVTPSLPCRRCDVRTVVEL